MAIQQAQLNKIKIEANISIARAKARQAQVIAHSHELKAKRMMKRPKTQ